MRKHGATFGGDESGKHTYQRVLVEKFKWQHTLFLYAILKNVCVVRVRNKKKHDATN